MSASHVSAESSRGSAHAFFFICFSSTGMVVSTDRFVRPELLLQANRHSLRPASAFKYGSHSIRCTNHGTRYDLEIKPIWLVPMSLTQHGPISPVGGNEIIRPAHVVRQVSSISLCGGKSRAFIGLSNGWQIKKKAAAVIQQRRPRWRLVTNDFR